MRKTIFCLLASAAFIFSACNTAEKKSTETNAVTTDTLTPAPVPVTQVVYACPMHPEVTGKSGDKCPKCKMDLTEVKNSADSTPGT